ncbi:hypothetical protein [Antarcticirhabdus aurantiaca]|uniref:Uncharacterized protein n=1 Tax=Antarcticirhabdus aurantiaca TaxID=2606717 RepID=A0ACD4NRH1_9HYPH|nr:hypothetical protein [Antarcticirhabdus aurantiaca]WAJ29526.1 hypothetical protein OXU80_04630 [Jeongeuplla avenae]
MTGRKLRFGAGEENAPLLSLGLEALVDPSSDREAYQRALDVLGWGLAVRLASREIDVRGRTWYVAATAEDLDGLGAGFIRGLREAGATVAVACLWIHRTQVHTPEPVDVAQIVREYVEPPPSRVDHFVALKSIIASSCVIRTSILRMLTAFEPSSIHVVAPVILAGAEERLESQFPASVARRFRYLALAEDSVVDELGNVRPGVGGNVYQRLGFDNQADKNAFFPNFLTEIMGSAPDRSRRSSSNGP